MEILSTSVILIIFLAVIYYLYHLQRKYVAFTKRVFVALILGIVLGGAMQIILGVDSPAVTFNTHLFTLVGDGYVALLRMIVMPLIIVSILTAIVNLKESSGEVGRISFLVIFVLLATAGIAALIGIFTAVGFGLDAQGMVMSTEGQQLGNYLLTQQEAMKDVPLVQRILDFIPSNPFLDMTGSRDTSTIAVVIFSSFLGVASLGLARKKPESFEMFKKMINALHDVVMRMVTLILRLTPYGVFALLIKVVSGSDWNSIFQLGEFILASYVALIAMFVVHLILIALFKINPKTFLSKMIPLLSFAFTSRSSMGSIPLNVETQNKRLGVSEEVANFSASFGATIGQNGCAAIYPAMLAVMIAPSMGIDPLSIAFIVKLVVIIIISSFGVAGVGGGATFAAIIVLSALNFPVALVGLLISIEPLIDMGRTALNVNGSVVSGLITSRVLGKLDTKVFNQKNENQDKQQDAV